jgi:hypothetical protein
MAVARELLPNNGVMTGDSSPSWRGIALCSSDTHLGRMTLTARWGDMWLSQIGSDRVAELVVSSLAPANLKLMAKELFSAMHFAVGTGLCPQFHDLIDEWAETADVESDPERRERLSAAHARALRGEGTPWSKPQRPRSSR